MVPKLRFKEFNEKWSTATMAEIYSKIRNGFVGTASPFYVSDGVKYLQGKNIKDGFLNENGLIFINNTFHQKQSKTHLKRNDLVMVQSGHVGECAVIDDNFEGANCHAILVLTPKNKLTPSSFFKYYFYSPYGLKNIYTIKTGNTIEHILSSDLKEISIYIPNIDEQNKIADFLSYVDDKITLLNKQYDLLCQYKKGMMQKIFSQELRFNDENEEEFPEWQLKQLSEIAIVNPKNKALPSEFIYIDLESVEKGKLLKEQLISKDDAPSRAQRLLTHGDVLFQLVRPYQKNNYIFLLDGDYVASTGYAQLRAKYNPSFLYQLLHLESFTSEVMNRCTGTSYPAINSSDLASIEVEIPCEKEQTKIANFLSALDDKISAKKAELDKLKIWKQGLLQQMFI